MNPNDYKKLALMVKHKIDGEVEIESDSYNWGRFCDTYYVRDGEIYYQNDDLHSLDDDCGSCYSLMELEDITVHEVENEDESSEDSSDED